MTRALLTAILIGAAVGLVVLGVAYVQPPRAALAVGDPAPDFTLTARDGRTVRLSALRGAPILLVAFEASCRVCRIQLAEIEHLQRVHGGLVVLGVAFDRDTRALDELLAGKRVSFDVCLDPEGRTLQAAYGAIEVPRAYLIDADGRIAALHAGEVNWRGPEIRSTIERLLQARYGAQ